MGSPFSMDTYRGRPFVVNIGDTVEDLGADTISCKKYKSIAE